MSTLDQNPWIIASRPKTLAAAIAPVLIGTALAVDVGSFHLWSALVALVGAVLIQIGTNYANDYYDYVKGSDTEERLGPTRATAAGLVSPDAMKRAFLLVFALAALLGSYLIFRAGWPIVIIGGLSILFAIAYTAGPLPLGYNGLGDIFVFIFFGVVAVAGTFYVQALEMNGVVLLAGIAPGLFSTAILTVNNFRDIEQDKMAGKKTLAVRFGKTFARLEYILSVAVACLMPVVLVAITGNHQVSLLSLVVLIMAIRPITIVARQEPGPHLNAILAQTGKMLLIFSILFSLGWII